MTTASFVRHVFLAAALCLIVAAGGLRAEGRSSANDERLKRALERFPEADTNKDGVLTMAEARALRPKLEALRRKMLERRRQGGAKRPAPTHADVRYGPHDRNVFDLWLPEGASPEKPVPVYVYFHGGGFVGGDKRGFNPAPYLAMGYAVVSSNYRFVNGEDVITPVPMQDCARAIQFLRHKAGELGIDPGKVAVSGGSAGAVITMWIAYKDDMADPDSEDPVCRQSTRVTCIVPRSGPTNLEPDWIRKNIGGGSKVHSSMPKFYGVDNGRYDGEETMALMRESSAVHHATADDPPTMLIYGGALDNVPLPENASQGLVIHHPWFGKALKDKLDALGVECEFHYGRSRPSNEDVGEFLARHFK